MRAISLRDCMPKISVVMPSYNTGEFIAEAIESAYRQSRPPFEVLVVDDDSTDATVCVAEAAGATVLRTAINGGPATARNIGIHAAQGELIAFLDADDVWMPTHLERCAALLEQHPEVDVAFAMVTHFGAASYEPAPALAEGVPLELLDQLWVLNPIAQSAAVVRRQSLLDINCYRDGMRHAEDYDLWLRLALQHRFICTHERLVRYRLHGAQHSRSLTEMYSSAWRVRHDMWCRLTLEFHPAQADQALAAIHRAYEQDLRSAWHYRAAEPLQTMLRLHTLVPESESIHRRWQLRTILTRPAWRAAAWVWDHTPSAIRGLLRKHRDSLELSEIGEKTGAGPDA